MRRICSILLGFLRAGSLALALVSLGSPAWGGPVEFEKRLEFSGQWSREWTLQQGQAFELSVRIDHPSKLPPNARIEIRWAGPALPDLHFDGDRGDPAVAATADWRKVLHALDPDIFLVYRAPRSGTYTLRLNTVSESRQPLGEIPHDTGLAPLATPLPARTPAVNGLGITVEVHAIGELAAADIVLEAEPNNAPEQAIELPFQATDEDQVLRVFGGSDDIEYYNNTASGETPDDWYRIEYKGSKSKFLSANLQLVEPVVSPRIRFYKEGHPSEEELSERDVPNSRDFSNFNPIPYVHPPATVIPGPVPVYTYEEGRDINERAHQQDRAFRTFVTRELEPGETYYLRVEANQPAYEMEVRLFDPAPYEHPVKAVRQAVYYHTAEIDAWLIHRPRNIAPHRRARDATALFGENCMSCHTQSGVWGVADAFRNGYRPEGTVQNFRRLANTMYESLRLTNELKAAAVNTSVAPNDVGDGPAGTRVAGRNIVLHERTFKPKKLHRHWQRRTANYVLQTADPKGINAAGRGSNFGPNVVFKFAAEILERAWRDAGDPRYFFGLEEKAKKIVATGNDKIKVTDDLGHRIEFFHRLWPKDYVETVGRLTNSPERIEAAKAFQKEFEEQVSVDMERLLALQREDGGWGFSPGKFDEKKGEWVRPEDHSYPAPTSVSLIALQAAGRGNRDSVVQGGVKWLLQNQYPYGLWNAAAATGFVTTAYAIRALSLLHPMEATEWRDEFAPAEDETLLEAISRVRRLQATGEAGFAKQMIEAAKSRHPQVRYYGLLGLGGALAHEAVGVLVEHLNDPVKSCREAAFWSLRQMLLDDVGWGALFEAYDQGGERTRQSVMQALVTRGSLTGSDSSVNLGELTRVLTAGMVDRHPGVRAFAFKAAWHWWVWNSEMREPINRAWLDALTREESEAQVDMAFRYSTIALFVVNGQVNNITGGKYLAQQYPELMDFYRELAAWREEAPPEKRRLLDRRLTAMAASHYMERANQQSPGQFAYSTPGATELFGKAVLAVYESDEDGDIPWKSIALEGARNITYPPLQDTILDLLLTTDQQVVAVAARALSNPGELSLPARPSALAPLLRVMRDYIAADREQDADAVANFLARVKWDFEGVKPEEEADFYRLLLSATSSYRAGLRPSRTRFMGRPAPSPEPVDESSSRDSSERQAALVARVLGENQTLHRKEAFEHLSSDPRLWLDSTEWMLAFREGGPTMEEAVEGATEAEDLEVAELTFGRTTEQMISGGIASNNTAVLWEEGKVGAWISFVLDAPEAGRYDLLAAFLYGPAHGIVEISLNGQPIMEQTDLYREDVSSTGPRSLGIFEFNQGRNMLTAKMLGSNPATEPEYKFGIDYVKLTPPAGGQELFTKDEGGADVIDPIVEAKNEVIRMFVEWFSPDAPREAREIAAKLANTTTMRRNPEVRKAIAAHVENEPVRNIQTRLRRILENDDETYGEALRQLISDGEGESADPQVRRLEASDEFVADVLHFRDYAFAEMNKIDPSDNRACISCHGVPGRVPTLYLHPPDGAGYIPAAELLANYRKMQQRVDLENPEDSKFLRKPLNIQSGQEDGHQGGLRYEASDPGFQVIRNWVVQQAKLQQGLGGAEASEGR